MISEETKVLKSSYPMMHQLFPHLAALHEDTSFWVYREFDPARDVIKFVVLYKEPDEEVYRVEAEVTTEDFDRINVDELDATSVRITYWGERYYGTE